MLNIELPVAVAEEVFTVGVEVEEGVTILKIEGAVVGFGRDVASVWAPIKWKFTALRIFLFLELEHAVLAIIVVNKASVVKACLKINVLERSQVAACGYQPAIFKSSRKFNISWVWVQPQQT